MLRRSINNNNKREKQLFIKRFYPADTYTWTVPAGCEEVDVFLVGGGGGGYDGSGGGGYTKTFKAATTGYRDGGAITVTPGETITIVVGAGGTHRNKGGYSQFKSSNYRASGGGTGTSNGYRGERVDQEVQVMPQQMRWVDQMEVTLMEVVTPIIRNVLQVQGKGIPLEILESQAENVMQGVVAVLDHGIMEF